MVHEKIKSTLYLLPRLLNIDVQSLQNLRFQQREKGKGKFQSQEESHVW